VAQITDYAFIFLILNAGLRILNCWFFQGTACSKVDEIVGYRLVRLYIIAIFRSFYRDADFLGIQTEARQTYL
jgi:hypothetical protein